MSEQQPGGGRGRAAEGSAPEPAGEDPPRESVSTAGGTRSAARAGHLLRGAIAGLVAGGAGLAVGELVAVATGEASAPVTAVGTWAISITPTWLEQFAIRHFGSNDKTVLLTGVYATVAVLAAVDGVLARIRLTLAAVSTALVGGIGAVVAVTRPTAHASWLLPSLLAGFAAALVLCWLTLLPPREPGAFAESGERRRFVIGALGTAAGALVAGFGGKEWIDKRYDISGARSKVVLPTPANTLPEPPAAVHPNVRGLGPFLTPNSEFYRVDTALVVPAVDPRDWKLKIHGMVDRPFEITFEELLSYRFEEHDMTLTCVSNPVGGPYLGNARWLGTPLAPLLRRAGVHRGADMILSTSTDGMTIGSPVEAVLDGRHAMLAVAMNGEALPTEHGFPCRMVIPGLYGYVSATKWVVDLNLTTFAASDAYWTPRGYSPQAPVKTASRIDVPRSGATVPAGTVVLAGTAWANHRGVAAVEVQIDDGAWKEAALAASDTPDTWRQWTYAWTDAARGSHKVRVRATDGTGALQTSAVQGVVPNGATGYHAVTVKVV
jgi:DMSO/TMAO reductase YedYZ molybdopterin-dependent catalytic subunit